MVVQTEALKSERIFSVDLLRVATLGGVCFVLVILLQKQQGTNERDLEVWGEAFLGVDGFVAVLAADSNIRDPF